MVVTDFIPLRERTAWFTHAACRGMALEQPNLFFPIHGDPLQQQHIRQAVAICETCSVRPECYEYGFTQRYGIWGGGGYRYRHPRVRPVTRKKQKVKTDTTDEEDVGWARY